MYAVHLFERRDLGEGEKMRRMERMREMKGGNDLKYVVFTVR